MKINEFISYLNGVKKSASGYIARCPAHNDKSPSLGITEANNGNILLNCFAGCTADSIVSSLGLSMTDLFADDLTDDDKKTRKARYERDKFMLDYIRVKVMESDLKMRKHPTARDKRLFNEAVERINKYDFDADEMYQSELLDQKMEIHYNHWKKLPNCQKYGDDYANNVK